MIAPQKGGLPKAVCLFVGPSSWSQVFKAHLADLTHHMSLRSRTWSWDTSRFESNFARGSTRRSPFFLRSLPPSTMSTAGCKASSASSTPRRHTPNRRVVRTLNGQELSISIPDNFHQQHMHITHHLQQQHCQQLQQPGSANSMMVSPALPSPNFNNFMLTLSPLMQLSSPQPTMSPRDEMGVSSNGGIPSSMYVAKMPERFSSQLCESACTVISMCTDRGPCPHPREIRSRLEGS